MKKTYKILHPNLMGLEPKKKSYTFIETDKGYFCIVKPKQFIGYPKSIIENNSELFELIK